MRPSRFALFALLLIVSNSLAQDADKKADKPSRIPAADLYKPTRTPDRINLSWCDDPATTMAVTWRTDTSVTTPVAQINVAGVNGRFALDALTSPAESQDLTTNLGDARYHVVKFTGLSPKTKYAYRVGDGVNFSEWFHFMTASTEAEPFEFIYMGDAQNNIKEFWSRVIRESVADSPKARFLLHAGDLVNNGGSDAEWGEWFAAGGWLNASVPCVATPGNHEYSNSTSYGWGTIKPLTPEKPKEEKPKGEAPKAEKPKGEPRKPKPGLTRHWRPQFTFPENGPAGLEESTYYFDYQGVRFVSLNSNEKLDEQIPWIEQVLGENTQKWTVVTFHHPVFSTAKGRDNPALRKAWQPLFDKYHVDLVLTGHDHSYGRSGLLLTETNEPTGETRRTPEGGTVYVVSVSGPKMYTLDVEPWMAASAQETQLYQIVRIDGDRLHYRAFTAVGDLYDEFELRKGSKSINALVERPELETERANVGGITKTQIAVSLGVIVLFATLLLLVRRR